MGWVVLSRDADAGALPPDSLLMLPACLMLKAALSHLYGGVVDD